MAVCGTAFNCGLFNTLQLAPKIFDTRVDPSHQCPSPVITSRKSYCSGIYGSPESLNRYSEPLEIGPANGMVLRLMNQDDASSSECDPMRFRACNVSVCHVAVQLVSAYRVSEDAGARRAWGTRFAWRKNSNCQLTS